MKGLRRGGRGAEPDFNKNPNFTSISRLGVSYLPPEGRWTSYRVLLIVRKLPSTYDVSRLFNKKAAPANKGSLLSIIKKILISRVLLQCTTTPIYLCLRNREISIFVLKYKIFV